MHIHIYVCMYLQSLCCIPETQYCKSTILHLKFFFNLFLLIYFWLRWVFAAVHGLLIVVASLVAEHGL